MDLDLYSKLYKYVKNLEIDIQFIIISNEFTSYLEDVYDSLGNKSILIHKKERLKSSEKLFYKKVLQNLCNIKDFSFDEYYELVNDEKYGLRNIIIKSGELRYN